MKKLLSLILACLMLATFVGCSKDSTDDTADGNLVEIEVEEFGTITVELYPDAAPITVANFKKLVSEKFYDGITFHRVMSGFMIQGGDPEGTGMGGSADPIKGEFLANGVDNPISHERGVISMARRGDDMDSASSQFFICHADSTFLDGQYAAFGKVTEGMDVVDAIASIPVNGETPVNKPVIKTIRIVEE